MRVSPDLQSRIERENSEDYYETFVEESNQPTDKIKLDNLQEYSDRMRKEVSKPHRCGRGCLCVAVKINLDLLDAYIKHARSIQNRERR